MKRILSWIQVSAGCVITAASFGLFIIPSGFACGGITGLGVIAARFVPLQLSVIVMCLNALLFLAGWIFIGKEFVLKTALTCVLFPAALDLFERISVTQLHPLVSCIIAGMLLGSGTVLVLNGNGSCCGFDMIGVIVQKYTGISATYIINFCSTAVIFLQFPSFRSACCGILVMFICTLTMKFMTRTDLHEQNSGLSMVRQ